MYLDKLIESLTYFIISKIVKPDLKVKGVTELVDEELETLINVYGIKGLILDVDETLRFNMQSITPEIESWIDYINTKLKVIVVSNGIDKSIEKFFNEKNIIYIDFAMKPFKRNIIKACNKLNLKPNEIAMVGDDLIDDIVGGKIAKTKTIQVENKTLVKRK